MNIKEWRKSKGYTLKEFAKICNKKSASTVLKWEAEGVDSGKLKEKLKVISDGLITNFEGE